MYCIEHHKFSTQKLIPLVMAIEREISTVLEREKYETITKDMTPTEAADIYRRMIEGYD